MKSVKAAGKADKIGVSVYSPHELRLVLQRFPDIELVQLPFNIYDQRFARSGLLDLLQARHIEVHARSAFLQGLLLMEPERLPERFNSIRQHQARMHAWVRQHGLTPLAAALAVCVNDSRIAFVVVGCDSVAQIEEILAAADCSVPPGLDRFAITDEHVIDPSTWVEPWAEAK